MSRPSPRLVAASALVAGLAIAGLLGCGGRTPAPAPAGPPWFADVTAEVGLDFVHDAGPAGGYFMPQVIGSGGAALDFDGDGRLDLYLVQNGGPGSASVNRLYRQGPDGKFTDATAGSGLGVAGHGMGVAVGDTDNDGRPDVLVTEFGRARLFRNAGGGKFTDVSAAAGIVNPHWGTSAAFLDYDRDGWLDLVVVNYVDYDASRKCDDAAGKFDYCNPKAFPGTVARLFRNAGGGTFEDATVSSGLGRVPGPGLGVTCADFDGDGWPDIFVANDGQPNRLWVNRKNGTFEDEAVLRNVAYDAMARAQAGMGVALGDADGDGLFDVFVTHMADESHTLWGQTRRGVFRDRTTAAGLHAGRWRGTGFGTALADLDHDGAPDLVLVNGHIRRMNAAGAAVPGLAELGDHWAAYGDRNQVFANAGAGVFRDRSADDPALCGSATVARGLVVADLDGDGALDLVVTRVAGPARVFKNVAPGRGHWLMVRAIDPALKRDAYGAEVVVEAGGRRRVGWVNPGSSYLTSNDPRAHVGLGPATAVDAVRVLWPDGTRERFVGGPADRVVEVRKGAGTREP